jgi:FMN phosphatase YigB (HAD superfamily)
MKKIILTDADGVLVTWLAGFESFMESQGHRLIPNTEHHYGMEERYGITSEQAYELIRLYNESPFIADLPAHADAVEYIGKLVNHGFKFVCITSISSHPNAAKYRRVNLEKLFGPHFLEIICLNMGSPKKAALMPWEGSGYFWIEDHIKNAEQGHELGLKTILVQQDHNAHYSTEKFNIVGPESPWQEIYHLVCKEYNLTT